MQSRLLKILGAVVVINVIARLLGFLREVIIGYQYGTSYQADSIITAFTIPNFIYIVIGGAITTAFISVYSKLKGEKRTAFVQTIFTGLGLLIGAISILFIIFPGFWIDLFFAGLTEEARLLTVRLFQLMAPATLFLAMAMAFSGLLNVHEKYRLTSFSTLVFNALFLLLGVSLTPVMMEYSYGLGASVGALFMLLMLVNSTRKKQIVPLRVRMESMPETKRFMKLAIPIMFGGATIQFYFFIQRIYATGLDEGVVSALNYASKMTQFPQAVLMTSVTTIIYPLLAKAVGEKDTVKVRKAYQQGFRMLTLILIPATAFLFVYAEEIIQFIFQYGNFDANSTQITYPLLQAFALAILGLALNTYVTRFFYAQESSYLPVVLNIISVFGVNVLVIELLIDDLGAIAIAVGTVVGTVVNMVLLLIFAKVKFDLAPSSWAFFIKMIVFVGIGVLVIWLSYLIPVGYAVVALAIGGVVTALFVLGGLKVVK